MTRQEAIDRWKDIVQCVLVSEDRIQGQWHDRLLAAKEMSSEERRKLADEYITSIATEILSKTSDEELNQIKQ